MIQMVSDTIACLTVSAIKEKKKTVMKPKEIINKVLQYSKTNHIQDSSVKQFI